MRALLILLFCAALMGCESKHCECWDTGSRKSGPESCIKTCSELFV